MKSSAPFLRSVRTNTTPASTTTLSTRRPTRSASEDSDTPSRSTATASSSAATRAGRPRGSSDSRRRRCTSPRISRPCRSSRGRPASAWVSTGGSRLRAARDPACHRRHELVGESRCGASGCAAGRPKHGHQLRPRGGRVADPHAGSGQPLARLPRGLGGGGIDRGLGASGGGGAARSAADVPHVGADRAEASCNEMIRCWETLTAGRGGARASTSARRLR
jgi:hypothetical protein